MLDIKEEVVKKAYPKIEFPQYNEVPSVGLYLDQVSKYINNILKPINLQITSSMISNYVKKKIITNPIKKQYDRDQIIYLMLITLFKSVMSLEQIQHLFEIQKTSYEPLIAYEYFLKEYYRNIEFIFGITDSVKNINKDAPVERIIFRNVIITVCNKIYMDTLFSIIEENTDSK